MDQGKLSPGEYLVVLLIFVVASTLISGVVIWWLWNWIIAGLFGVFKITFWQGVGIGLVLSVFAGFFKSSNNK